MVISLVTACRLREAAEEHPRDRGLRRAPIARLADRAEKRVLPRKPSRMQVRKQALIREKYSSAEGHSKEQEK